MLVRSSRALVSIMFVFAAVPVLAATPDAQFAMQAAQGGLAEVQTARLAVAKSKNALVQTFAQRMIADHTANNAKLAAIVRAKGLAVPTAVDPNSRAVMAKLQRLSGAAFDRSYMASQVAAHQQMQILMQAESNGGKDARLMAYAKTTLSAVNMHLNLAKSDVAQLRSGGSMSGGSMSGGSMSGGSMSGGAMHSPVPAAPASPGGAMSPGGGMSSGGSMSGSSPRPMPSPS